MRWICAALMVMLGVMLVGAGQAVALNIPIGGHETSFQYRYECDQRYDPDCTHTFLPLIRRDAQPRVGDFDLVGTYSFQETLSVAISDGKAYIQALSPGLGDFVVVDLTNPAHPTRLNDREFVYAGAPTKVFGTTLYGLNSLPQPSSYALRGEFLLIDVSDPANPVQRPTVELSGGGTDLDIVGNRAYIAHTYDIEHFPSDLDIFDISTSDDPQRLGHFEFPIDEWGYAGSIRVRAGLAYIGGSIGDPDDTPPPQPTLFVMDVRDPQSIAELGRVALRGDVPRGVEVSGGTVVVAGGESGVEIVDVSNPRAPRVVGLYDTPGEANQTQRVGNVLYVADGNGGLLLLDIAEPTAPALIATYQGNAEGSVHTVVVADGLIYLGSNNGLHILRYRGR
jgi:hypothetical protein